LVIALCLCFNSYRHWKTRWMLCRSGISPSNEITNLKANIFVDDCSSCTSYCEPPPHACKMHRPTIAAMLETDRSIYNRFLCYGKTTQYTMVRLHHGIPHGITMIKPRGITTWSYHGNTSVLVHHRVPWYTKVNHGISYHGIPW